MNDKKNPYNCTYTYNYTYKDISTTLVTMALYLKLLSRLGVKNPVVLPDDSV